MKSDQTTALKSSISTLIEMDQEEAVLKEQLQKLKQKKEEAKKTEGGRAKDQLQRDLPEARVNLLALLRTAQSLGIPFEEEYTVTLGRIVKDAGATGIPLSLVLEVLPDIQKLQVARDQLGKNGTDEIAELKAKEHLKEGKGRGLFFVWNERTPQSELADSENTGAAPDPDSAESEEEQPEEEAEQEAPPPPPKPAQTKPTTQKPAATRK